MLFFLNNNCIFAVKKAFGVWTDLAYGISSRRRVLSSFSYLVGNGVKEILGRYHSLGILAVKLRNI